MTCGSTDRGQGGVDRSASGELLPEAGDDEEAEVHRQADPERDHQVEGEDGQRDQHQGEAHDAQGDGDGEHRPDQWYRRGPKTPEHEEQQQQQEREGVEFCPSEVLRRDGCDLDAGHRWATEPGVGLQRRLGGDGLLQGGDRLLLVDRTDGGHHRGEGPVARDHAPVAGVGVVEDALDLRAGPEDRDDRGHPGREGRGGGDRRGSAHDDDVALFGVGAGHPLDLVLSQHDR